jgi:transposase
VKTNKSDFIDAEAIAEAVARPTMRFVPIKTDDQLDLQSLHRVRERWVMRRTAVINQIRGLLLERDLSERIRNILRRVSKSLRPENLSQFDRAEMQECLLALEQMKMLMSELEILHLLRE